MKLNVHFNVDKTEIKKLYKIKNLRMKSLKCEINCKHTSEFAFKIMQPVIHICNAYCKLI